MTHYSRRKKDSVTTYLNTVLRRDIQMKKIQSPLPEVNPSGRKNVNKV